MTTMAENCSSDPPLAAMRANYSRMQLRREDLHADPITQFNAWLGEAIREEILEPNAMSLATVGADGQPLLRTVLLKDLDARGFVFFTNYESRKARHIAENPLVSLLFPWRLAILRCSTPRSTML